MKKYFLLVLITFPFGPFKLVSQNLIPNAGFEHKNGCPTKKSHFAPLAKGWSNPTSGTPDYYHTCGGKGCKVPNIQYGIIKPYNGDAFVGLNIRPGFREYIRIRLTKTLKRGVKYSVQIHVRASKEFSYTSSDISFYFSGKYENQWTTARLKNCEPQISNPINQFIPTDKWTEIKGDFIAKGGEKYVTIGSFRQTVNFEAIAENPKGHNSYVFIDNLSTIALKRPKGQLPPIGKLKTLKSIYFEHDKYVLNKESFKELNELAKLLNERKKVKIEILGHTDISGDEEHNITLSKNRALAVVNYLIKKGISKERLKHKGLGSSVPIDPKNKNEKQAINRRVEFRVID